MLPHDEKANIIHVHALAGKICNSDENAVYCLMEKRMTLVCLPVMLKKV